MAETLAVVATAAMRCTVSSMGCGPWLQFAPTTTAPQPSSVRTMSSGLSP